jgi:NhaA family Na+:H+ antiporter
MRRALPGPLEPLREFLRTESASGVLLVVASGIAMVWANLSRSYEALWASPLPLHLPPIVLELDARHWINDAAMALFFFVVGLEIKRELIDGELRDRRQAMLPVIAAFGGMVAPALIYLVFNAGRPAARGWGIPMATDIAFAVGALALAAPRAPAGLKVFLLSIAIVDDIGAIVVIALFYSGGVGGQWLLLAALTLLVFVLCWRLPSPWRAIALVPCAVTAWFFVHKSGVHPTIAGALLGLLVPATAQTPDTPAERLAHVFHPWTSFVIVPLFALANAGIALGSVFLPDALAAPVVIGIVLGLVLGKFIGIGGTVLLLTRLGIAGSPGGATRGELLGVAALGGIGFTVSLFITQLAFVDPATEALAKLGVFTASVVAALLGVAILRLGPMRRRR